MNNPVYEFFDYNVEYNIENNDGDESLYYKVGVNYSSNTE